MNCRNNENIVKKNFINSFYIYWWGENYFKKIFFSARTVAGHEAARLGSQLAASQRQRREREAGVICEPRARSYDHQRQEKPEKSKFFLFQLL